MILAGEGDRGDFHQGCTGDAGLGNGQIQKLRSILFGDRQEDAALLGGIVHQPCLAPEDSALIGGVSLAGIFGTFGEDSARTPIR